MGKTTYGGACKAAAFLVFQIFYHKENFVEKDVKWAHIDIAGYNSTNKFFMRSFK
jgi:leucyl aminopeptidase